MPLTDYQKNWLIQQEGLDPSQWDVDEQNQQIVQKPTSKQPAGSSPQIFNPKPFQDISATPMAPIGPNGDKPLATFGKTIAQEAVPTMLGGLGAGLAMGEMNPLAHIAPPYSEIASGVIGAGLGAFGGRKLQSAIEPEAWQQNVATSQQQNPIAATLGGIATIPLSGFMPNPSNTVRALGTGAKVLTGAPMEANELQNLINVGVGAALPPIQQTAESLISGQGMPSIGNLAQQAAIGAVFNKPNALGRLYGFHGGEPIQTEPTRDLLEQPTIEQPQQISTTPGLTQEQMLAASGAPLMRGLKPITGRPEAFRETTAMPEVEIPQKGKGYKVPFNQMEAEQSTMEGEGGNVFTREELAEQQKLREERQKKIKDFQAAKQELADQQLEIDTQDIRNQIEANRLKQEEQRTKPLATTELGKEIMPDYTGIKEQANVEAERESAADLQARQEEARLAGEELPKYSQQGALQPKTALEQKTIEEAQKENLPVRNTENWFNWFKKIGIDTRNIELMPDGTLVNAQTGEPVAGESVGRLAKINPNKATAETVPHEMLHIFGRDLANSPRTRDTEVIAKLDSALEKTEDYKIWKAERDSQGLDSSVEEYRTTDQGINMFRRAVGQGDAAPNWWKDFAAYLKTRYSKHATIEDFQRLLSYKFYHDPSYAKLFGGELNVLPNVATPKQQEEGLTTEDTKPIKVGYQEGFPDKTKGQNLYNLQEPIKDAEGNIKHPVGSTVSENTLKKYGVKYSTESAFAHANKEEPAISTKASFSPFLTSRIDKIAESIKSPTAKMVTEQLHKFAGYKDLMAGRIGNKLIQDIQNYPVDSIQKVYQHLHQVDDTGKSSISLTPTEKKLADTIVEDLRVPRRLQQKEGPLVKSGSGFRQAGIKPEGYMFNMLDPKVAYTWAEKPLSAESKQYDTLYLKHQMKHGVSEQEAKEMLREYKGALGSQIPNEVEFGALRKAEGNGLPWELVDQNFASAASRYGNRAAADLSYFKYIQNDPKMLKALNLRDQYGKLPPEDAHPEIDNIQPHSSTQQALRSVFGIDMPKNPRVMALARVAANSVMGVGTAIRNVANMPAFIAGYVQTKQMPLVAKAIMNMNESRVRAFKNNAVKANFSDFDAAGYYEGNPNPAINLMNKFSSMLRKYQGRDLSDKFEGSFYYSLGELLAADNIARAKAGNRESVQFVKRFGDIVDGGSERLLKGDITNDDIQRVAKRFVDAARGTYGAEGLPSFALEGELAPFAALSRFSIEKANTIWKDVIMPAKQGIYGPMIRYALGSLLTGIGIEQLNELLSNKRGPDAKINEILAEGKPEELVPKAISLLQLASFAGIIGDGAKFAISAYKNKSLKLNQPLNFPLYTLISDTLAGNISDAASAIKQGEDPFEVMGKLATAISTQSVQSMRYVDSNFIHPEDAKKKERFRDLRVFNELEGKQQPEDITRPNPFQNLGAKQFKETQDIGKAVEMLPDLINKALDRANGNPERLKSELMKIKENNYQTMPNPESMPISFVGYITYLQKTQGEEKASEALQDYLIKNAINKAKGSMVPSL